MRDKPVFFYHSMAVSAIFFLGGGIIALPDKNGGSYSLAAYLICGLISMLLYFLIVPIANFCFSNNTSSHPPRKLLNLIFLIITSVYALFCVASSFKKFTLFASRILLPEYPIWVTALILLLICIFFATRRQEDVLKFGLLSFVFILMLIIFFFLAMINRFDYKNIIVHTTPTLKELWHESKEYLKVLVIPSLLLPVYQALTFNHCGKHSAFLGVILGFILLGLCLFGAVLLFGTELSGKLDYPYASAVSTITVGRLFTRLDGFSYYIYFASTIIRVTVSFFVSFTCLKKIALVLTK